MNILERLSFYFNGSQGRPILAIAYFLTSFLSPMHNPVYWQAMSALVVLAGAFSLNLFLNQLFKYFQLEEHSTWADYSTVFWLVSPWLLGSYAWATVSPTLISMIFFSLSGYYLFRALNQKQTNYALPALFFLLSCLTYEAFYLQFLVFLGLIWIKEKDYSKLKTIGIWFAFAQILPIIWNRSSSLIFTKSIHKSINPYWLQTFVANILSLPYALYSASPEAFFIILIFMIYAFILFIRAGRGLAQKSNIGYLYAIISIGIIISLFIFAIAGYTVWGLGTRGRTMMTVGLWLPLLFGFTIAGFEKRNIFPKGVLQITLLILVFLGYSQIRRSLDWVDAWQIQKNVYTALTSSTFNEVDGNAVVIADLPFRHNEVALFDAFWTIDMQMNYGRYFSGISSEKPLRIRQFALGRGVIHQVNNTPWTNRWQAKELVQFYKNDDPRLNDRIYNPEKKIPATSAWLYSYNTKQLRKLSDGEEIICQPEKNYDYWMTYLWNKYVKKRLSK
jgi:hypothetical protein